MSRIVTLTQLRTWIRQRADLENNAFVSDAELTDLINHALGEFQDILLSINGDMRAEKEAIFATGSGQRTYSLPADFLSVTGVFWNPDSGQLEAIPQYMGSESQDDWLATGWSLFGGPKYRLQAGSIRFVPIPSATYQITLKYVPNGTVLALPGDTVDSVNYWDDWVVWHCVAVCNNKQETDPSFALQERERTKKRILHAAERSMDGPQRIQLTRGRSAGPDGRRWG